jgi:hypothetical protein
MSGFAMHGRVEKLEKLCRRASIPIIALWLWRHLLACPDHGGEGDVG